MCTEIDFNLFLVCPLWCLSEAIWEHGSAAKRLFSSSVHGGIGGHYFSDILRAANLYIYYQMLCLSPLLSTQTPMISGLCYCCVAVDFRTTFREDARVIRLYLDFGFVEEKKERIFSSLFTERWWGRIC